MPALEWTISLLQSGLGNLAAYLAAHVLLCLMPAFFIAGGLTALVPQQAITRYLGPKAKPYVSYPAAALGGFVLAVCSCTILPIFAGIYKKGAGLGPAITFLFVGPAINILALSYTGVALGMDIAIARLVLSAIFGVGIGLIMALIFSKDDEDTDRTQSRAFSASEKVEGRIWLFMLLLLAILIAGTLQVGLLTNSYAQFTLPINGLDQVQDTLNQLVPFDASVGEEGVSVQGMIMISLLVLIALTAWRGLNKVDEGYTAWTWVTLGLIAATMILAALRMTTGSGGLEIAVTGKMIAVLIGMIALFALAKTQYEDYEIQGWLWETWRFVKQIFPLLIAGVFVVGAIRGLIKPEWIQTLAGRNTVLANLVGVVFGVFMYFPTLVEVPIANMFLSLGMHRGPLLAYLMADPELSLQSILITASIIGKLKAWVYVAWVAVFSTLAGLIYGAWVDGASLALLALYLGLGLLAIVAIVVWGNKRQSHPALATTTTEGS